MARSSVPRGSRLRRVGSSTSGKLGRKAPAITAERGPTRRLRDPAVARAVWLPSLRYPSKCRVCRRELPAGSRALWRPGARVLECEDCVEREAA